MYRYIIKRLLMMLLVLAGVSFMIYFIMDLAPGDLATSVLGEDAPEEALEAFREENGLNKPVIVRYAKYMWNLFHGDLGFSYRFNMDVMTLYLQRLPNTLRLAFTAIVFSTIISIPLGVYSALRRGTLADNVVTVISMFGLASPNFWVGLMLIILFSLRLGWFNSGGMESLKDIVLPAVTVGVDHMASYVRTTRSSMIDVLSQDYLQLARAKGAKERTVIWNHALRNALIPIVTVTGMLFSSALGGAVITETVFSWPGVGRLVIESIRAQEVEVVTGVIILTSMLTSIVLLAVDILYAYIDPRIKAQYKK